MMPTTSAASTPSRRAIRKAESTGYPVVNDLQLQIRVYRILAACVNRTVLVRFPFIQNRLSCFLHMGSIHQALSLILSSLLVFSQVAAPSQPPASPQTAPQRVRPDPKRARKAAEQGEKAEAAGRLEEALAAFQEAARYAPQDIHFAARAEAQRSKLVRTYADAAERDALAGRFDQAAEDLAAALAIDPANANVLERLRQIKSMEAEAGPQA